MRWLQRLKWRYLNWILERLEKELDETEMEIIRTAQLIESDRLYVQQSYDALMKKVEEQERYIQASIPSDFDKKLKEWLLEFGAEE